MSLRAWLLDRSCRVGFDVGVFPPARTLGRQRRTRHQIDHGFGDVRRMITDPLIFFEQR